MSRKRLTAENKHLIRKCLWYRRDYLTQLWNQGPMSERPSLGELIDEIDAVLDKLPPRRKLRKKKAKLKTKEARNE